MTATDDETEWGASKWLVHPREPDGAYAEGEATPGFLTTNVNDIVMPPVAFLRQM